MLGCKTTAIAAADISFARHPKDCKCEENISARRVSLVPTDHPSFGSILKLQNEIKKMFFFMLQPVQPILTDCLFGVLYTKKNIRQKSAIMVLLFHNQLRNQTMHSRTLFKNVDPSVCASFNATSLTDLQHRRLRQRRNIPLGQQHDNLGISTDFRCNPVSAHPEQTSVKINGQPSGTALARQCRTKHMLDRWMDGCLQYAISPHASSNSRHLFIQCFILKLFPGEHETKMVRHTFKAIKSIERQVAWGFLHVVPCGLDWCINNFRKYLKFIRRSRY